MPLVSSRIEKSIVSIDPLLLHASPRTPCNGCITAHSWTRCVFLPSCALPSCLPSIGPSAVRYWFLKTQPTGSPLPDILCFLQPGSLNLSFSAQIYFWFNLNKERLYHGQAQNCTVFKRNTMLTPKKASKNNLSNYLKVVRIAQYDPPPNS